MLKKRTFSRYSTGEAISQAEYVPVQITDAEQQDRFEHPIQAGNARVKTWFAKRSDSPPREPYISHPFDTDIERVTESVAAVAQQLLRLAAATPPTPLTDAGDEQAALYAYQTIKMCAGSKTISLSNTRCLVDLYRRDIVLQTVRKMLAMHAKGKISNPSGFVITAARVSWRARCGVDSLAPAPRWRICAIVSGHLDPRILSDWVFQFFHRTTL